MALWVIKDCLTTQVSFHLLEVKKQNTSVFFYYYYYYISLFSTSN